MGEYLERIFPLLQVRFISVNDGYDSSAKQYGAAGDLDVGMRNLINELYSRNISRNVKTARQQYAVRGECVNSYSFYGYVKGAEDRRRLEIDPPAADTVRLIFSLWLEGNSTQSIADILNERHILSPSMHKRELGVKRTNWSKYREEIPWTQGSVRVVLQNESYTGKLISLRSTRRKVGNPKQTPLPKEEWIAVDDAFKPIITKDVFQRAQTLFRDSPAKNSHNSNYPLLFSRKLLCGVCGMGLVRQKASRPYYKCKARNGPHMERCGKIRVFEDELKAHILSELHDREAARLDGAEPKNAAAPANLHEQVMALEQQIEKQWTVKKDAFVRSHRGLISQAEYESICNQRQQKIQSLQKELEMLSAAGSGQGAENTKFVRHTEAAGAKEVTREMLDGLVQGIRIFEDGEIQIEWKATL